MSSYDDYAKYLSNVFKDDPEFQADIRQWAKEEIQHGVALGRWARLVDPGFDYDKRLAAFREGYSIQTDVDGSVRGSRAGELIARCIVEVGTSSHYTSIADATDEPVLKAISRRIATDEWRHYGLFYRHLNHYLEQEQLPRLKRAWIAFSRMFETEDDELRLAYHFANAPTIPAGPYDRKKSGREYAERTYGLYNFNHIERAMGMVFKAVGFAPHGWASRLMTALVQAFMYLRTRRLPRLTRNRQSPRRDGQRKRRPAQPIAGPADGTG